MKHILSILVLVSSVIFFGSCSKESDERVFDDMILGSWTCYSHQNAAWDFDKDHISVIRQGDVPSSTSYTYQLSKDQDRLYIRFSGNDGKEYKYCILKLEKDSMEWINDYLYGSELLLFTRPE